MMNSLPDLTIGKLYGETNPKLFVATRGLSRPASRSSGGTSNGIPDLWLGPK